jgi:hypothetical protein
MVQDFYARQVLLDMLYQDLLPGHDNAPEHLRGEQQGIRGSEVIAFHGNHCLAFQSMFQHIGSEDIPVFQLVGQDAVQQFFRSRRIKSNVREELLAAVDSEGYFGKARTVAVQHQALGCLCVGQLGIQCLVDCLCPAGQGGKGVAREPLVDGFEILEGLELWL